MKKIFVLAGNFGVGKSAIVNFHKHQEIEENDPFTKVHGVLSLGGERGADELNHMGYNKEAVYTDLLPRYADHDILVHSVFYQNLQDINRFTKTHDVVVLSLRTPYEVNAARIAKRSDGKKKINDASFVTHLKNNEKVRQFCAYSKSQFYKIDNDRPLKQVATEVWDIIDRERDNWG